MACQGALAGMGDPKKIAWGSLRVFPFPAPKGHFHLLALDTGCWLPFLLLTLPLVGLYLSWPQGGHYPWFLGSCPLWGGKSLAANLSAFLSFEPQGLAPVLHASVLIRPPVLPEVPHSSVLRLLHFLLRAQRPQVGHWYLCCFLVLEPCSAKGLLLFSSLPISLVESPKYEGPFSDSV